MSKQRKIQKIIFCILAVILVIIFYEAIGIYTAYKKQPKVSSETKTAVQEEIKNWNQISENPERATIIEENNEAPFDTKCKGRDYFIYFCISL